MGSAVIWGDPQPLEWCAEREGGECNWGFSCCRGRVWGPEGEQALPQLCFSQAVPEMTEILKKK